MLRSLAHPDKTPRTRLSMKNEPMMMRGMKYSQFHVLPEASLVCKSEEIMKIRRVTFIHLYIPYNNIH